MDLRNEQAATRNEGLWPPLPLEAWKETQATLHLLTQIVGKTRLVLTPPTNHWWHSALYLTARGMTTSPIPHGDRTFEVRFDFIDHRLIIETSDGRSESIPLIPRTVAAFYREYLLTLRLMGLDVHLWRKPSEMPNGIPFDEDTRHAAYNPEWANRCFRVLLQADRILKEFMGRFLGKQSPSHFFWGGFDLAQTRFSGRRGPERPGADLIDREAYSHEVISFGFWPGTEGVTDAAYYAYAQPPPKGFENAFVRPAAAAFSEKFSIFVLPYEAVRHAEDPKQQVLDFFQSVYDAGAILGHWDRASLDRWEEHPVMVGAGEALHPAHH
jgi:Family of unknown function (DUF5996)